MPKHNPNPSGRPKGSKNRRTKELEDLLESRLPGWDPVIWMAHLAADGIDHELLERVTTAVLLLESCKGKTAHDTTKIRKALKILEETIAGQVVEKELRVTCAKEVAQYLRPKRKAVEVTTDEGPLAVQVVQNLGGKP